MDTVTNCIKLFCKTRSIKLFIGNKLTMLWPSQGCTQYFALRHTKMVLGITCDSSQQKCDTIIIIIIIIVKLSTCFLFVKIGKNYYKSKSAICYKTTWILCASVGYCACKLIENCCYLQSFYQSNRPIFYGFIKWVDNGWITSIKDLEGWNFGC